MMPPFYHQTKEFKNWLIWSVFVYSLLVFNLLEPFEIEITQFIPVYHLLLSGHAVLSALTVYILEHRTQPKILPPHVQWNEQHSFMWVSLLVVFVCVVNWLYIQLIHFTLSGWNNIYVPHRSFFEVMPKFLSIYMVWGLICCMSGFFLFNTQSIQDKLWVTLITDSVHDSFKLKTEDIICFQTCDNYLELYYRDEFGQTQKRWMRSSMKKMQDQLNAEQFLRCHQSFIVNVQHIKGLVKSKNQTLIEVAHLNFMVPVSRSNLKQIKSLIGK